MERDLRTYAATMSDRDVAADRTTPRLRRVEVDLPAARPGETRLGDLFAGAVDDTTTLVLVGFPSDEGVRRNGGRPGAAEGPLAIREALWRTTPDPRRPEMAAMLAQACDLGDVEVSGDLERDQEALGATLAPHLAAGRVAVILGGGHETAFGTFLGHVGAGREVSIVNLDAHPDVRPSIEREGRPLGHSGSPFRQAIEHESRSCVAYAVAGLQPSAVAAEPLAWMRDRGATAVFIDELPRGDDGAPDPLAALPPWLEPADARHRSIMASLDLDAVEAASAPGVSAPSPAGLPVAAWLAAAERLGADARTTSLDLVELSPRLDVDGRAAKVAALTIWRFLRGWSGRSGATPIEQGSSSR